MTHKLSSVLDSEFGLGPSPFYLKNGTNVTAAPNSTNNTGIVKLYSKKTVMASIEVIA